MPNWTVTDAEAGERLDKFLAAADRAGSRARAVDALDRGRVFVNDREVSRADAGSRVAAGDVVRLWVDRPGSAKRRATLGERRDLPIVYEDDRVVVLDKPPGLLAVPLPRKRSSDARSVFDELEDASGPHRRRPFVVHRIDRDTSGWCCSRRAPRDQETLKAQFIRHEPERVYLAIVYGHPSPRAGTWRDTLVWDTRALIQKETTRAIRAARRPSAHYRVVEALDGASLIEVSARHRQAQSDPHPGAAARPHAGWRAALHLRARDAAADRFPAPGAPRLSAHVSAPDGQPPDAL